MESVMQHFLHNRLREIETVKTDSRSKTIAIVESDRNTSGDMLGC